MLSLIALIALITLIVRSRLYGHSWPRALITGVTRYLQGLIAIAGLLLLLVVGIGTTRAILHPVADAALSLFPEGQPPASWARHVPKVRPTEMPVLASLPRLTPTPRTEAARLPQAYVMDMPESLPEQPEEVPQPTPTPASLPIRTPSPSLTPTMLPATPAAPSRTGCDEAYPDAGTCIPPGPPFDQGCAITEERRFRVLPPDPQGLDHDNDGIGCEPVS